jgi:WhiB family redox-sensing transcriptional regulator
MAGTATAWECFTDAAVALGRAGMAAEEVFALDYVAARRPAWMADAACRAVGLDVFFGADTTVARAVCAGCEVREPCLAYALAARIPDGMFGGLDGRERARLPRPPRPPAPERTAPERPPAGRRRRGRLPCSECGGAPSKARGLCPTCYARDYWRRRHGR